MGGHPAEPGGGAPFLGVGAACRLGESRVFCASSVFLGSLIRRADSKE